MERAPKGKRLYLFLDEVQKVRDWQDAVIPSAWIWIATFM